MSVYRSHLSPPQIRILVCGYTSLRANRWNYPCASFPYWTLYWNPSEGATLSCRKSVYPLRESRALLIPPYTPFSTTVRKACGHLYLHFQVSTSSKECVPNALDLPLTPPLSGTLKLLRHHLEAPHPAPLETSLAAQAVAALALVQAPSIIPPLSPPLDLRVQRAAAFLETRLQPGVETAQLAREAGMSIGAFNRLFKKESGFSPQAFLRHKRVEKAALLLQFSELSVDQIAEQTGFCDRFHLTKIFRAQQGLPPAQFRNAWSPGRPPR